MVQYFLSKSVTERLKLQEIHRNFLSESLKIRHKSFMYFAKNLDPHPPSFKIKIHPVLLLIKSLISIE